MNTDRRLKMVLAVASVVLLVAVFLVLEHEKAKSAAAWAEYEAWLDTEKDVVNPGLFRPTAWSSRPAEAKRLAFTLADEGGD